MKSTIGTKYELIAGHFLPKVPEGHKCRRPHGHNYEIEFAFTGEVPDSGFIIDFYDVDKLVKPLIDDLDHRTLNDFPGLENPTAEIIANWFRGKIEPGLPAGVELQWVKVWETKSCWALSLYQPWLEDSKVS